MIATVRTALATFAALVAVAAASPAHATAPTININPGNVPATAAGYDNQNCEQGGGPYAGQDVWVFVLPGEHATSGDFVTVTADFGADGLVTITAADNPGSFANGGPATAKAWIVTDAGFTLVGATATITGTADSFNLTHTCPASDPSPSPTPSVSESPSAQPSSPAPSDPASSVPPSVPASFPVPSGPVGAGGGGSLSETTAAQILVVFLLIAIPVGGMAVVATHDWVANKRRRNG